MSLTVQYLLEILQKCPKDMIVVDYENRDFVHIINLSNNRIKLSTLPKIGECNECGSSVHETDVLDYPAVCTDCDENKYEFEITRIKT